MDPLFEVHKLNEQGLKKAQQIAEAFDLCTTIIAKEALGLRMPEEVPFHGDQEWATARRKLEEACFYTKKAMACDPRNQESKGG